jgi:hypothetical protein
MGFLSECHGGFGNIKSNKKASKIQKEILVAHLDMVQANLTNALKLAYFSGFRDARDKDYLGCDAVDRWEYSDVKAEIDKNE